MNDNTSDTQLTPNDPPPSNQDDTAPAQNVESPTSKSTPLQTNEGSDSLTSPVNIPEIQQSSSSSDFVSKTNNPKSNRLLITLVVCVAAVLIVSGAWYIHHRTLANNASRAASITIANEKIPPASCVTAHKLIKQQLNGDKCYVAKFKVGTEPIQYVVIEQSQAYQQKQASECQLDCGGSISTTRYDYIVRANGKVQFALPDWTEPAEPDIDELTGCGDGNFSILNSQSGQATFVQDNGDIGLYVTGQNVKFPDQYGDNCNIDFKLTQDMTNDLTATTGLSITQLKVHYELQPLSACQQRSGSNTYECYQDQAIMRNDLALCSQSVDPSDLGDGDESCITDTAERRQDPSVCTMIQTSGDSPISQSVHNSDVQNCETTSTQLSDVFRHKLIVD